MSAKLKTVLFIVVLCVVCSVILTFGATVFRPLTVRNALLDQQISVLRAAHLLPTEKVKPAIIQSLYTGRIGEYFVDFRGQAATVPANDSSLRIFVAYSADGRTVEQVILPFSVKGMWGDISGYLALNAGLDTVTGFTVYDQNETAGLGAEIAAAWFQEQWRGKKLFGDDGTLCGVGIAKGRMDINHHDRAHTVDGISGATATGRALSQGLHDKLERELPELQLVDWNAFIVSQF